MYLKRLELAGFKTFADRTELEFTPGITAIVGPNGSGKSNIWDAIRWSLGEANVRHLRGSRLEDVIFAGSEGRRAVGMATVSLTLDNSFGILPVEFAEVTVTRRATRGGEGECFLNTVPCRLRDIQMLFLGTGLGGRSYAMIGQGEVDAVLNASPEERRVLLEEAAGLARYKRRRQEAERRLTHAAHHLERLGDILGELETRLVSLGQQAETARQYQAYMEEMRRLELTLLVDAARRLAVQSKRMATQEETARQKRDEAQAKVEEIARELADVRAREESAVRAWEEAQRQLLRVVEELAAAESAVQLQEERLRGNAAQQERVQAELNRLQAAIQAVQGDMAALRAQESEAAARQAALQTRLAAAEGEAAALEAAAAADEERLEALRADAIELARARAQAQNEMAALRAREAGLQAQVAALAEQAARLDEEMARLDARRMALLEEADGLRAEAATAESRIAEEKARLAALAETRQTLDQEERQVSLQRQAVHARLQYLEEAQTQYAGYEQGAREILLEARTDPSRFAGLLGTVAERLCVPAEYRVAVEAALDRRTSALLASSPDAALAMLQWVRARGLGGTFVALGLLKSTGGNGDGKGDAGGAGNGGAVPSVDAARRPVLAGDGIVGWAVDLVDGDGAGRPLVEALLGDVMVVRDLQVALRLRDAGVAAVFATTSGEVLTPAGVLSAAVPVSPEVSVLGRAEALAAAKGQSVSYDARLADELERQRQYAHDAARAEAALAALESSLAERRHALVEREKELAMVEDAVAAIPSQRGALAYALHEAHRELARLA
ncbi:MAG: AAA family ATPase, partial [Armatimonadetes bacterium]|nr:AAA family ATPase [Armatimonadota bacterium]